MGPTAEAIGLFHEHLEWSKKIAARVHKQLPPSFAIDDLEQEAAIALWDRAQRYEPLANDNFRGYAYLWIRGAILMKCRRRAFKDATADELDPLTPASSHGPEQLLAATAAETTHALNERKRRRWIVDQLAKFPKSLALDAYVVRRIHVDGWTIEEAAGATGLTIAALTARLTRGSKFLGKLRGTPNKASA